MWWKPAAVSFAAPHRSAGMSEQALGRRPRASLSHDRLVSGESTRHAECDKTRQGDEAFSRSPQPRVSLTPAHHETFCPMAFSLLLSVEEVFDVPSPASGRLPWCPFSRKREVSFMSLLPQAGEGARRADEGRLPSRPAPSPQPLSRKRERGFTRSRRLTRHDRTEIPDPANPAHPRHAVHRPSPRP